jgi:CRP/FNR family transcriptional regulator, cyclic AMP receptor protein
MPSDPGSAPFPAALDEEELQQLAARGVTKSFPRHAIIVHEGDQTDSLYIIVSGKVKVFVADAEGREAVLGVQGPGEYFGEMVLDGGPRSASVMTLEHSRVVVVPRGELRQFLAANPAFAVHLIHKLIQRVRLLTRNVKSLALMDVYGRVAHLLLSLATDRDGLLVVTEKLTQQEIANRVGASREMISRVLKDLAAGGYISIERKLITLHKHLPPRW